MFRSNLLKLILAGTIIVPVITSSIHSAMAQKFVTKQSIVNGLQIQNPRKKRVRRSNQRVVVPQFQNQPRVVKRRAPVRAPASNGAVVLRRAPAANGAVVLRRAPSSNGQVAVRRAPAASRAPAGFRAPGPVVKRRAPAASRPPQVAERRAPAASRAPRVAKRRAPAASRAPQVAERRAPAASRAPAVTRAPVNRAPQRFNTQVTSNSNNDRAIRVDQNNFDYANRTAVDLEILFDYDSARISPDSVRQLITLGEALQDAALSNSRIMIVGHTDAAGSNQYNANLSYLRAQSVSDFLTNYAGIFSNRLVIEGFGEERLKYPDAPNSGQNRRVEIINLGS